MRPRIRVRPRSGAVRVRIEPADDWQRVGRRHFLTRDAYEETKRWEQVKRSLWRMLQSVFKGRVKR